MSKPTWIQILEIVESDGGYVTAPEWGTEGLRRNTKIAEKLEHTCDEDATNALTAMFEGNLIDHTAWNPQETHGQERIYITQTGYTMLQQWRARNQQQQLTERQTELSRLIVRLTTILAFTAIIQALASVLSVDGETSVPISESFSLILPHSGILFSFYLTLGIIFLMALKRNRLM